MATIDQQFVEYIVKTLVNNPEKVAVDRQIDEKGVLLSLSVDPDDVGRVIGRRGQTAQSIRTLLRALGTKNDARYNLKIVNTDDDRPATSGEPTAVRTVTDEEVYSGPDETVVEEATTEEVPADEGDDTSVSDLADRTRAELDELDDLEI